MDQQITLGKGTLQVRLENGHASVSVSAREAMRAIGSAYGLYSSAEENRDERVVIEKGRLVIQKDTSYHGRPEWETTFIITSDPQRIQRYMAFKNSLKMLEQIEREREQQASFSHRAEQCEGDLEEEAEL